MSAALCRLRIPLLIIGAVGPWLLTGLTPQVVPPGNIWKGTHTLGLLMLLGAALFTADARAILWRYVLYGVVGGCGMFPVFMPDSRDMIAIGMGRGSFSNYVIDGFQFVFFCALCCGTLAAIGRYVATRVQSLDPRRCSACGYPLYGLPERRCPECGQTFDHLPPPTPSD